MFGLNPISSAAFSSLTGQSRSASITEQASGQDVAVSSARFFSFVSEASSGLDTVAVGASTFSAAVAETVRGLDNYNPAGSTYHAYIQTSLTVGDTVVGSLLWNPIPDDQTPDWTNVNNTQAVTWNAVSDNQTANWQNVDNSQPDSWTDVNDAQTPGWDPIEPQG